MIIRFQNQNIRVYFAENLKYLLKKNHLSYKQFMELLEYDQSQLYKVGQWTNSIVLPTVTELVKICILLQQSIQDILTVNLQMREQLTNEKIN